MDRKLAFFSPEGVEEGLVAIHYPSDGVVFKIRWDAKVLPYLAGSIETSPTSGERKLSLRPTNGYLENWKRLWMPERRPASSPMARSIGMWS